MCRGLDGNHFALLDTQLHQRDKSRIDHHRHSFGQAMFIASPLIRCLRLGASLLIATAAAGCATLATPPPLASDDCTRWFAQLDAAVDAAGVRDAQDERITGFEFLRVDRLAVSTRDSLAFAQWLQRAAELDSQARDAETANLPASAFPIDGASDGDAARHHSNTCRDALSQRVLGDVALQRALLARARVPDRYDSAQRVLGIYALLRWPFYAGVQAWQDEHVTAVAQWAAQPPAHLRFEPPSDDSDAPVFEIESQGGAGLAAHDRFGVPAWTSRDAMAPAVDSSRPVVYRRTTHTLYGGRWLRQQVYTLWFAERPPLARLDVLDLLAGTLDGVIVRVTLAPDGTPLVLDTIHACGCWHQFYAAPEVRLRPGGPTHEEWVFVAGTLPLRAPGQRLAVRLASGTHHVMGVANAGPGPATRYTLRDENMLRTLPLPDGGSRSLYAPDGLVHGSERAERFFFWPMGIASAGAMRQWGHHATAFVGRRHFDDADLIERRFSSPALDR